MAAQDGLSEGEHVVLRLHPHWKTVLRPILVLALIIAVALVLLIMLPSSAAKTPVRLGIGAVGGGGGHRLVPWSRCCAGGPRPTS